MSDAKLRLPDFLIADLYKQTLVQIDDFIAPSTTATTEPAVANLVKPTTAKKIQYLGDNRKNVIILVDKPGIEFLPEKDLQFLTNILKACNLSLNDIAVINNANEPVIFTTLKEELGAVHIFLFDVQPTDIKVPFVAPHFQVQKFDGTSVVYLPTLEEMNLPTDESVQLKRNLWTSLKKVFGI